MVFDFYIPLDGGSSKRKCCLSASLNKIRSLPATSLLNGKEFGRIIKVGFTRYEPKATCQWKGKKNIAKTKNNLEITETMMKEM